MYAEKMPTESRMERVGGTDEQPVYVLLPILIPEKNPIIYKYFDDYTKRLYDDFKLRKLGFWSSGAFTGYKITKKGELVSANNHLYEKRNYKDFEHVRQIIINNPPEPFPAGMESEEVNIEIYFCKAPYNDREFDYYSYDNHMSISIDKKPKWIKGKKRQKIHTYICQTVAPIR